MRMDLTFEHHGSIKSEPIRRVTFSLSSEDYIYNIITGIYCIIYNVYSII